MAMTDRAVAEQSGGARRHPAALCRGIQSRPFDCEPG